MIGELTYNELLASPDLEKAVKGLSDFDLFAVRAWLAEGNRSGWVAERVHGLCILDACGRWEREVALAKAEESEPRIARNARMEEITIRVNVDFGHGSEVAE